jgi:hypothetical protein
MPRRNKKSKKKYNQKASTSTSNTNAHTFVARPPFVPSAIHRGLLPEYNYMIHTVLNNSSLIDDQIMFDVSNEEDPQDDSNNDHSHDIAQGSPINAIRRLKKS